MSQNPSIGILFKEALSEFSKKYENDDSICGIKIDLRSQGVDLIVGIRFSDEGSKFAVCTAGTNCESADNSVFEMLSIALQNIGVESKSGAGILIKRNATVVTTDEGCSAIESVDEAAAAEDAPKRRSGLFALFGKK